MPELVSLPDTRTTQVPSQSARVPSVGVMRAAVLAGPGHFEIRSGIPQPEPGPGEVRVRMQYSGVCASNLSPWEGQPWFTYPFDPGAPGHEGTGWIDALGEGVCGLEVGDHCAVLSYHAFAEYDLAAQRDVVRIPAALESEVFLGEPLGCAMNIFKRAGIHAGQTVAIVGIGFLGALLVQLATNAGAQVIAIGRRESTLDLARESGAWETIPLLDHAQVISDVARMTNDKFCDVVIEATGKQWPLDLAGEICGVRGRLVIAGYHQEGARQVNMQLWNWRGLDVINAHERDPMIYVQGMHAALDAVAAGEISTTGLITHRFTLEEIQEAFRITRERPPGFMKAILTFASK